MPDTVADSLVDKCASFLEKQIGMMQSEQAEIKSDFSLYSTFAFLNNDLTASIELISEDTGLNDS